jgi:bacterioferritin-associated ferredoxin
MYVCLCQGVTDGQIRDAILEGCCSYRDVRQTLGVASKCGKCATVAKAVVRESLTALQSSQVMLAYPAEFSAA